MRRAAILFAGAILAPAVLAQSCGQSYGQGYNQGYGQPYPLNQYPQAPSYQQPYQPSPQPYAPQAAPPQGGDQLDSREAIALQNQLLEMRRDLQALEAQRGAAQSVLRGRAPSPGGGGGDLVPQLLDRVSNLEEEVRRLRGQAEETQNQLQRQQQDFGKQLGDLQFRLQTGGAPSPSASSAPPEPGPQPAPARQQSAAPRRTAELAMQEGNAALARRDYTVAEASAQEILSTGRTGPRGGDAQLLLAQALAGKHDYQGAAVAYGDAYQRLKGGARGQDALLGLANSLNAINEKQAACGALDQLRAAYTSPRRDVGDAAASLRGRAGCR